MDVVSDVIQHVNPGQTPVIAVDQPLFEIAKLIQWNMPETHGENKYYILLCSMDLTLKWQHLKLLWSGWIEVDV